MNPQTESAPRLRIAIDGPAGSGKSTIGAEVARRLGFVYVDTGAFYRALTLLALREGISPEDEAALARLSDRTTIEITHPTVADGRQYTVLINGYDETLNLRSLEIEAYISLVSRHPLIRADMRERQRRLAGEKSVVMVGRDIGTVVLPDAEIKVYLNPDITRRAERRHADLVAQQGPAAPSLAETLADMRLRDERDAPNLVKAADAHEIDNSTLATPETVARVLALVEAWRGATAVSARERGDS